MQEQDEISLKESKKLMLYQLNYNSVILSYAKSPSETKDKSCRSALSC